MRVGWSLIGFYHVSVQRMPGSRGKRSHSQFRPFIFTVIWIDVIVLLCHRVCLTFPQHKVFLRQFSTGEEKLQKRQPIKSNDESEWVVCPWGNADVVTFLWSLLWFIFPVLFKVYCCDNTYTTIRASVSASVRELIGDLAEKLGSAEDLLLVSLGSAGGGSGGKDAQSRSLRESTSEKTLFTNMISFAESPLGAEICSITCWWLLFVVAMLCWNFRWCFTLLWAKTASAAPWLWNWL